MEVPTIELPLSDLRHDYTNMITQANPQQAYHDFLYTIGYNFPSTSGVYGIACAIHPTLYVGSTKNLTHRAAQHFKALEDRLHHNWRLQEHFDQCGASSFSFIVLEYVPDLNWLGEREQVWIDRLTQHWVLLNRTHNVWRPEPAPEGNPDVEWEGELSWEE